MQLIILNTANTDLKTLENHIIKITGWEEGSFDVAKMTFTDESCIIVCNYPADLTEEEARKILNHL